MAVILVESSQHTATTLGADSILHSAFPADPDAEFATQQTVILRRLKLALDTSSDNGDGAGPYRSSGFLLTHFATCSVLFCCMLCLQ